MTVHLSARYKPENEDAYEMDRWGYTERALEPELRPATIEDAQAALVATFVPYAGARRPAASWAFLELQ